MTADASQPRTQLSDAQRLAWLRLIRSEKIGPATFRDLLRHFGDAAAAIEAAPDLAARGGRGLRICPIDDAEREIVAHEQMSARLIAVGETDYPSWLAHVDAPPPLVSVRGDPEVFLRPAVAIVGSRNASIGGIKFAKQLARDLGGRGMVIASGLARGVDAAAHQASLASGTIAVLAGGLDRIYPPDNVGLAEEIFEHGGAWISEMPLGWAPRARDFPRRNRIISGLAAAVVVVEAATRSGSLITARHAGEQGRLVFAVPGSPLDPRSVGANRLIRDGARIVTDAEDIVAEIDPMLGGHPQPVTSIEETAPVDRLSATDADDGERQRIVEALGPAPVEIDEIVRFTGLTLPVIHHVLLELDLAGRIARHPGGRISMVMRTH